MLNPADRILSRTELGNEHMPVHLLGTLRCTLKAEKIASSQPVKCTKKAGAQCPDRCNGTNPS